MLRPQQNGELGSCCWEVSCSFLGMGNAKNARGHSAALWCSHFHADGVSQGESRLRARPKGMKTNEVCDRPLETFGAVTPMLLSLYWRFSFWFMLLDFHRSRTDLIRLRHLPQRGRFWGACAEQNARNHPAFPLGEGVAAATDEVRAARAYSMKMSPTESRGRVKGGTPL